MPIYVNYTTGYAGTGKSTALLKKVKSLPAETTIVIAPTHKALNRLREGIDLSVDISTIHSLLGWIPTINENATHISHIDTTHKLNKELDEYTDIVIDEAGMMSEEMFIELIAKLEVKLDYGEIDKNITMHLYLDPFQLLPVKGQQIRVDSKNVTKLITQHRADSLDIVNLYTKFVHYIEGINLDDLTTPYSENVLPLDISKFRHGDRLLAYTNAAVGEWNQKIAKTLNINSYEGVEVQLGNRVEPVLCERFVKPTLEELLARYNGQTLILQNSQINSKFLESSLDALIKHKDIQFIVDDWYMYPVIVGIGKANAILTQAKKAAIEDRQMFKHVYTLGRAFIMDYTFASTVHKSQGSEFNNVFIDKADIQKSILPNYYMTYSRLMYVAISRAKNKIYL